MSKKFDIALCNPPYDRNLHLKILEKVIPHCEETINISPITWLAKHNIHRKFAIDGRKSLNGKIENIKVIEHREANDLFGLGNAIETLGIIKAKNDAKNTIDLEKFGFKNESEYNLYKKIDVSPNNKKIITFNQCKYNDKYGNVNGKRKENDVSCYTWNGGKTLKEALVKDQSIKKYKKESFILYFDSNEEKKNFLDSLDTKFMNWYYHSFVEPADNKLINMLFRMNDYTHPWTSRRFCDYFNITGYISDTEAEPGSEWEEILNTMKKYK